MVIGQLVKRKISRLGIGTFYFAIAAVAELAPGPLFIRWGFIFALGLATLGGTILYERGEDLPPAKVAGHAILGYLEFILSLICLVFEGAVQATSI